ncbi:hypothetical protein [Microbacterium resistens]
MLKRAGVTLGMGGMAALASLPLAPRPASATEPSDPAELDTMARQVVDQVRQNSAHVGGRLESLPYQRKGPNGVDWDFNLTSGGTIEIRADWGEPFLDSCRALAYVRFGVFYRDLYGQEQISNSIQINHDQKNAWFKFWRDSGTGSWTDQFPAGAFGFYARVPRSDCYGGRMYHGWAPDGTFHGANMPFYWIARYNTY